MGRAMKTGAKGIKTSCSGRLGGADMARTEFYSEGRFRFRHFVQILTMDSQKQTQHTAKFGVKAWVYNGEVLPTKGTKEGSDK